MERFQGLIGIALLLAIAWALSTNRRRINPRIVISGMLLQVAFAVVILRTPVGYPFFQVLDSGVNALLSFSGEGSKLLFAPLDSQYVMEFESLPPEPANDAPSVDEPSVEPDESADDQQVAAANLPVAEPNVLRLRPVDGGEIAPMMRTLAFVILPTVIFFGALLSALYHFGIMQRVVQVFAWVMQKTMGTSGAESLSVAADIFVGQTEAPLVVRPYLLGMTKSELHTVMCGGFASIAGGVMAAYVAMLSGIVDNIAGHLMAASVMSAPAGIVLSKMMYPEEGTPQTAGNVRIEINRTARNVLEAIGDGAHDGLKLALNIGAMLIAIVALVALVNAVLGIVGTSLQDLMAYVFRPIAWSIGVPWDEAGTVGMLLGEKIALTEFIAYAHMARLGPDALSPRSGVIASYALCGFANFASIGVQIGGLGALVPERKRDVAELALRAMIAGAMATCMTAAIAGILV